MTFKSIFVFCLILLTIVLSGCINNDKPVPLLGSQELENYYKKKIEESRKNGTYPYKYNDWKHALDDYEKKREIINDKITLLSMTIASKDKIEMDQKEFVKYLKQLEFLTKDFTATVYDIMYVGSSYIWYLDEASNVMGEIDRELYLEEYDRIKNKDDIVLRNNINIAVNNYNREADRYNSKFFEGYVSDFSEDDIILDVGIPNKKWRI